MAKQTARRLVAAGLMAGLAVAASASEFRSIHPIPTPAPDRPDTGGFAPVNPRVIHDAVQGVMRAWNTPELRDWLGDEYYDRSRVLDAIDTRVPRDARLRVLAIESIQTLKQSTTSGVGGQKPVRRSLVAVIARTVLEFNDPVSGFERREGENEYIFEVKEVLK